LQRIRRGVHVWASTQAAAGQALGRRDDDDRYHSQDSARRPVLSMVQSITEDADYDLDSNARQEAIDEYEACHGSRYHGSCAVGMGAFGVGPSRVRGGV